MRAKLPSLAFAGVIGLALLVYWQGLRGPFVFDDAQNLAPLNDWLEGRSGWQSVVLGNGSGPLGRPLSMLSFALNVALLGPSSWAFKFGNLLIHLLNGCLVVALFNRLSGLGADVAGRRRHTTWLACLAGTAWLLHPLLAGTVLYVVQRMAMLSTTFVLLAVLAFVLGRCALDAKQFRRAWVLLLGVPIFTCAAALAKENGVLALPLCAVVELIMFQPRLGRHRSPWSRMFIGGLLVAPAVAAGIVLLAPPQFIVRGYDNLPFTLHERVLTQARILWDYIGLLLVPRGQPLGLYHDDYQLSRGLLDPATTLLAIVAWIALAAGAWRTRRVIPGLALGIGWFLVGHALESTFFPLMLYFEHRNYLPAIGAIWAVASVAAWMVQRLQSRMQSIATVLVLGAGVFIVVSALVTATQARIWSSQDNLLAHALAGHPDSALLRVDLIAYLMALQPPRMEEALTHAAHLRSRPDRTTRNLGAVETVLIQCATVRQSNPAMIQAMYADRDTPISVTLMMAYDNLSDGLVQQPCLGLSPEQMADGLSGMLDRSRLPATFMQVWRLRYRAANLYLAADQPDKAIVQARLAAVEPAQPQIDLFLAALLIENGEVQPAKQALEAAERKVQRSDSLAHGIIHDLRTKLSAIEAGDGPSRQ